MKSRAMKGVLFHEIEIEYNVTYYHPYRPAPACANHDDPKFSDPGDDEEIDFDAWIIVRNQKGEKIAEEPLPDMLYDSIADGILEVVRNLHDDHVV